MHGRAIAAVLRWLVVHYLCTRSIASNPEAVSESLETPLTEKGV